MNQSVSGITPVSSAERLATPDILRGFALMGILLMNIVGMGLHPASYTDPTAHGGSSGVNLWVYIINAILADGKMRGLFSMLFGAGIILFAARAERRDAGVLAADLYYRRTIWLMLFGIAHAFLFWFGDILFPYALCGLFLFPFRKLAPRGLIIAGALFLVGLTAASVFQAFEIERLRANAAAAEAARATGQTLTEEQEEARKQWSEKLKFLKPDAAEIQKAENDFRGGFLAALKRRASIVLMWHSMPIYSPLFWDMFGMMLTGMALLKLRFLTGECSNRVYLATAIAGYAAGLPLHAFLVWRDVSFGFDSVNMHFSAIGYQPASVAVCLAHVSVVVLAIKSGVLSWLTSRLAAAGQMAFSNYIAQSVITAFVFCGFGLGLYGTLERHQLYYVVLAIWTFQLAWSPVWLRRFRFGPLEWAWRSLAYWQRQPMGLSERRPAVVGIPVSQAEG